MSSLCRRCHQRRYLWKDYLRRVPYAACAIVRKPEAFQVLVNSVPVITTSAPTPKPTPTRLPTQRNIPTYSYRPHP
ncbi:hypothetical protein CHS0354_034027 [Potamilus streckersoni]|uniref:Uncharacterized protein n=1 Tax=Potamilus streckersoni TaxID=2493646 RepID=A0AAE0VFW7_9BIVA|nr:hypothetical protein CHS0354_034027 [Potamilus streckersoni]